MRYKQVKYISTRILNQIVDSKPYHTTDCGTEYHDQIDEIHQVLWSRKEKKFNKIIKDYENKNKIIAKSYNKKWCSKCDKIKELEEFSNRSDHKHLKRSHCKTCNCEHVKIKREPKPPSTT